MHITEKILQTHKLQEYTYEVSQIQMNGSIQELNV